MLPEKGKDWSKRHLKRNVKTKIKAFIILCLIVTVHLIEKSLVHSIRDSFNPKTFAVF